ncbi:hypothetical protein Poly30_21130 [Planctomycetes bacterium Poly30]|uniref:Uncharacterized protein n=1 Tax=Saltatorellus ferox TaxID=2528018 RepID=A0A518ER92_9BACT|nr:hypothetical protein Poly30_21130 [Planctomycetes bacterium Poly30]
MGELGRCRTHPSQVSGLRPQTSDPPSSPCRASPPAGRPQAASGRPQPTRSTLRANGRQSVSGGLCRETCGGRRSVVGSAAKASGAGPRDPCDSEMPGRPIVVTARSISGISPDGEIAIASRGARRAGVLAGRASSPDGRPRRTGVLAARAARASLARATQPLRDRAGPGRPGERTGLCRPAPRSEGRSVATIRARCQAIARDGPRTSPPSPSRSAGYGPEDVGR